jgi:hypothetical protein
MKRFILRLIQFLAFAIVMTVAWGLWYLHTVGFPQEWRNRVGDELRKSGVEVQIHRLLFHALQGLVAHEVKVMDKQGRTIAEIDEIVLDVNYANLMHHQSFLNGVHLRKTNLSLQANPDVPAGPRWVVSNINASVLLPPDQVYVSRAEADFYGIHVSAAGRLINPGSFRREERKPDERQTPAHDELVGRITALLQSVRYPHGAPRVDVRFSGDLAKPHDIFVEATAEGNEAVVKNARFRDLAADVEYRRGRLQLRRLHFGDSRGTLDVAGSLDARTADADFQARSTLDLPGLVHVLKIKSPLEACVFSDPPLIEAAGGANLNTLKVKATGRIAMGRFEVKTIPFQKLTAAFAVDDRRFFINDVLIQHSSGQITARAMHVPGDFRAKIESNIDLSALLPFADSKLGEFISELEFADPPLVQLAISGTGLSPLSWTGTGDLRLGRTKIRGAGLNEAQAKIEFRNRTLALRDIRVARVEGTGSGTLIWDFPKDVVYLENVRANLIPAEVVMWFNPKIQKDILPYRFHGPPNLRVSGTAQVVPGDEKTNLEVLADAPRGLDYVFLGKNLPFGATSGRLLFKAGRLYLSNVRGQLFGGLVRTGADISIMKEKPGYTARIDAEGVDFEKLTSLYFNYKDSRGRLDGYFDFRSRKDPRDLAGTGTIRVTEGNVFAIPILGPFSGILNALVPGMGYNKAHKASATFAVNKGVIDTSDFLVDGQGFAMIGGGKLFYLDDKIDFSIRINAQGLPGILLFPVSKILEYGADGTLSKPGWRPKIIPKL